VSGSVRLFAVASFLGILLFAHALPLSAERNDTEASPETLEKINREIEDTSRSLDEKRKKREDLLRELESAEEEMNLVASKILDVKEKLTVLDGAIDNKKRDIKALRDSVEALEKKVRRRLSALYKGGEAGMVAIIFSDETPSGMARRYDYFSRIVRHDREQLSLYRQQVGELASALEELDSLRRKEEGLRDSLQKEKKKLTSAHEKKKRVLARVGRDEEALKVVLEELKDRAARMENFLKKLESSKPPQYTEKTNVFEKLKGKLPWPAKGTLKVGFGRWRHPELDTYYDSQGLEIEIGKEKPVSVVADGQVVFSNTFKGYGKLIIVDHGNEYYTLYARLSRLTKVVGDTLGRGDVVGFSGFSGGERLYFEVRRGGTPLDPTAWLAPR